MAEAVAVTLTRWQDRSMSGYDKSPDYGGPPVGRGTVVLWAAVIIAVAVAFVLWTRL